MSEAVEVKSADLPPVKYYLDSPLQNTDGTVITVLTFREATAEDACVTDTVKGDFASTLAMLSSMCGVPLPILKKLKLREMKKIVEAVSPLMGNDSTDQK